MQQRARLTDDGTFPEESPAGGKDRRSTTEPSPISGDKRGGPVCHGCGSRRDQRRQSWGQNLLKEEWGQGQEP